MIDYALPLDQLPDPLPIEPLRNPFDVTITPPGSKSITCRAYVLAALAEGESKIIRPLRADDTDHLLNALCTLGAKARWEGEDVYIKGVAGRFPRGGNLYMGEGGTPTRFMIACACLAKEPVTIDASPRMRERPIAEGVDMLRQLGAKIEYVEAEGRLPVRVVPSRLIGAELTVDKTLSSQSVSAILLIASWIPTCTDIQFVADPTSRQYVYVTLQSLMDWDADFSNESVDRPKICVRSTQLRGQEINVEPDASSAAYWIVAAALCHSKVVIPHLRFDSQQPDAYVAKRLQPEVWEWRTGQEWASDVKWPVDGASLRSGDFDASTFPDGALALAVAMSEAQGRSRITGLRTLRVKETDRIAALANELRKVGCAVATGEDWIEITPAHGRDARATGGTGVSPVQRPAQPIVIETYNDHRMAMAFAVLGLNPPNGVPLAIRNPKCVAKSYPGFWKDFAKLYQ